MTGHEDRLVGSEVDAFSNAMIAAYDALRDENGGISTLKMLRVSAALYGQMLGASVAQEGETCPHCETALQAIMQGHADEGLLIQAKLDAVGTA